MNIISEYSKIIAEQIRLEKGNQEEVNDQINNLLNIIEYENKELLNTQHFNNKNEFPEYLFENENVEPTNEKSSFRNYEELKKKAMNEIWKVPKLGKNNLIGLKYQAKNNKKSK